MNLTEISDCLLESENDGESLRAASDLHALFSGIVELSDDLASADLIETHY